MEEIMSQWEQINDNIYNSQKLKIYVYQMFISYTEMIYLINVVIFQTAQIVIIPL